VVDPVPIKTNPGTVGDKGLTWPVLMLLIPATDPDVPINDPAERPPLPNTETPAVPAEDRTVAAVGSVDQ